MLQDLRRARATRSLLWCPSRDGHLRYSLSLARALDSQAPTSSHRVDLLSTRPRQAEASQPFTVWHVGHEIRNRENFRSSLHWIGDRIDRRLTLERKMCAFVDEHPEFDLIHLQELYPLTAMSTLRRLHAGGRAVVLTLHNTVPHSVPFGMPPWAWLHLTRRYLRQIDAIIVHSDALAQEAIALYGLEPDRVRTVPHGTWVDEAGASLQTTIMKDRDQPRPVRLLAFGQIRRNKGLAHLLDALDGAPKTWELQVAGSIADAAYWEQEILPRVARLRARGRVIELRTDWIPPAEVPGFFKRCDIVALPYDGFHAQSGVLFDAIAHCKPVVTSGGGTLGQTVAELGIGTLAPSLSAAHLRQAIAQAAAIDRAQVRSNFRRAGQINSWAQAARETWKVYDDLLEKRSSLAAGNAGVRAAA